MARRSRNQAAVVETAGQPDVEITSTPIEDEQAATPEAAVEEQPEVETEDVEVDVAEQSTNGAATHCAMCGKLLSAPESVVRGLGPLCASRIARALGVKMADLTAKSKPEGSEEEQYTISDETIAETSEGLRDVNRLDPADFNPAENVHPAFPERGAMSYVKLADVHKALDEQNKSIGAFVRAFGGNRNLFEPKDWYWTPVYVGNKRYLPAVVMDHLNDIPERTRSRRAAAAPTEASAEQSDNVEVEVIEDETEETETAQA